MSFSMGSQAPPAATSELCLRFPEDVGIHSQISYEQALGLLTQAVEMAQRVPFIWSYIDKPPEGKAYLTFMVPSAPAVPPDGIRWLEQEKSYRLPVSNGRELEVSEVKYGFVPNVDSMASRSRRRFRMTKGGNSQLLLIHYPRGDTIHIPTHLLTAAVRSYPLRPTNEPRVYVAGEHMGQKVQPAGPISHSAASSASHPTHVAQPNGVGINVGLGLGIGVMNPAAALAQQSQATEALERERRSRAMAPIPSGSIRPADEEESGDEYDPVSTRTLAIERFKRNHELMAEVFTYASQGHRAPPISVSPYASLDINELNQKVKRLTSEVEALSASAEERRIAREAAKAVESPEDMEITPPVAPVTG